MKIFVALCLLCIVMVNSAEPGCEPKRACPRHYDPMCGSDGRTYGNWCLFKAELQLCNSTLNLVHCGECHKD